ncbi:hypothetical protein L1887_43977 [Cichorium endivia]|nr:hypothetical protein L1887_43977 [Cichorium endivia]
MFSSIVWLGTPCTCAPRACASNTVLAPRLCNNGRRLCSEVSDGKTLPPASQWAGSHHSGRRHPVACARTCCTARARHARRHALCLLLRRCLDMVLMEPRHIVRAGRRSTSSTNSGKAPHAFESRLAYITVYQGRSPTPHRKSADNPECQLAAAPNPRPCCMLMRSSA